MRADFTPFTRRRAAAVLGCAVLAACGVAADRPEVLPLWVATDVVVADLDGDERADVLTLAMYADESGVRTGHLLVYRQTLPGVFAAPVDYAIGRYPWRMAVGDIDGDGAPDVVVVDVDDRRTALLRQDPSQRGRLLAPRELIVGVESDDVVVADLNGDGLADVAVGDARSRPGRVVVSYQDSAAPGSFGAPVDMPLAGPTTGLAAGDIDGDGRDDLVAWVVTSASGVFPETEALVAAFQQADGSLEPARTLDLRTGLNVGRLAIADLDGDGRRDLFAFLTPQSAELRGALVTLKQLAPREFGAPADTSLEGIAGSHDAALVDLAADDSIDVAVVRFYPVGSPSRVVSVVNVFANTGSGVFTFRASLDMPVAASRIASGDLDADGRADLVMLGAGNQALVMFQRAAGGGSFTAPQPLR